MNTLQMLLDNLEADFIWEFLAKQFEEDFNEKFEHISRITQMLLSMPFIDADPDIQSKYLPLMLERSIEIFDKNLSKFSSKRFLLAIEILEKIFLKVNQNSSISNPHESQSVCFNNHFSFSEKNDPQTTIIDNEFSTEIYRSLQLDEETTSNDEINGILNRIVSQVDKELSRSTQTSSIRLYQKFFHDFISNFLIDSSSISNGERIRQIYSILQNQKINRNGTRSTDFQVKFRQDADQYVVVFQNYCQLFLKFIVSTTNISSSENEGNE